MPETADNKHSAQGQRRTFVLLVSMFICVQVVILALAFGALALTNLIRAYTMGEGLYAKAQKQAVYALQRYAYSGDPADFEDYRDKIRVPLGDAQARAALEQEPPDVAAASEGLLQGRNHPDDVSGMIDVFLLFKDTALFEPALRVWREADTLIREITDHAEALRAVVESDVSEEGRRSAILADIQALDREVTLLEDQFSEFLGATTRLVRNVAFAVLGLASVVLWLASLAFGSHLHRRSVAAEVAVVQREERLRILMDSTADGIVSIDTNGRIDAANRAAARVLGCEIQDLQGRPIEELIAPPDRADFTAALLAARSDDSGRSTHTDLTFNGQRADNSTFPMEVTLTRQEGSEEIRLIVTLRDITDRRATETRLFQAQKMESVGQLTGGIAHDFNNLLTVVMGNLETLRSDYRKSPGGEESDRLIRAALGAAQRGARVTSYLLAFSRRQPLAPKPVDVDALIAGMRELFSQTVSEAIDLSYRLGSRGWQAMVDPVQLEGALLNLVINARHATLDGGTVTIESRQHVVEASEPNGDLAPGQYLMIRVSDTGSGIAPEYRDRVFEPFFTTKDVGGGSGLGLSMVHGFAKQSGGHVRLQSEIDKGTTIELYLPRAAAAAEPSVATPGKAAAGRPEATVLVVEDDPAVRAVTIRLLQGAGYKVSEAADGAAALDALEKQGPPDLLLSDVVLPCGMDGYALASQARMRFPGIRVLLMSGYPRDALAGADTSDIQLLQKPFTRSQLHRAVEETLSLEPVKR